MKHLKYLPALFLAIITVLASCEKEEIEQADSLEQFGILGKWRLSSITIDGITDMSIRYDTIEFSTGIAKADLKGEFRSIGPGNETKGLFELDNASKTLLFDYNDTRKIYLFHISENSMTFTYSEYIMEFIENWSKVE